MGASDVLTDLGHAVSGWLVRVQTDAAAGAGWFREVRVCFGDPGQAREHLRACWPGASAGRLDVQVHLLGPRQRRAAVRPVERMEEMEPLLVEAQHLGADLDAVAGAGLAEV